MPLKIQCPHCRKVLVAEDDVAGQRKLCPACGKPFDVPKPAAPADPLPEIEEEDATPSNPVSPRACPRCKAELGPRAEHCHKCHTVFQTGKRLPLTRRLALVSPRTRVVAGFVCAVTILGTIAGIHFYRVQTQPVTHTYAPSKPRPLETDKLAAALLDATDAAARQEALQALAGIEDRVAPAVAVALEDSIDDPNRGLQARLNREAAIDLLVRNVDVYAGHKAEWIEILCQCQVRPELFEATLCGRARMGDMETLDTLSTRWLTKLDRYLFLTDLADINTGNVGAEHAALRTRTGLMACADGLRTLATDEEAMVFERLAEAYWPSWCWLGQQRGDRFARELFDLAKPEGDGLEFRPEYVRGPRDMLRRVNERGTPEARAAAGLILKERAPQYKKRLTAMSDILIAQLPNCDVAQRQRLLWAIARMGIHTTGGDLHGHPRDVAADEVANAMRRFHPDIGAASSEPCPEPPRLVWRVSSVEAQLQRDLLRQMRSDWDQAAFALETWLDLNLGSGDCLAAAMNPGQREPNYPALAAAMVIVADAGDLNYRSQLELWREATDQPEWVRALAYTVLGSFDARGTGWRSNWPADLRLSNIRVLAAGQPGWSHFGRVIASGGRRMIERLEEYELSPLSADVRDRLSREAREAARKRDAKREP